VTAFVPAARRQVLADLLPGARVRDVLLVLGSAVFMGLVAQVAIPLPFTPVPLTLGTFGALLIGASLGPLRGGLGLSLYLVAGVLGVPWFANHQSGWERASFGYVIGYVIAAVIVGRLAQLGADRTVVKTVGLMAVGSVVIYACGVPWLMAFLHVDLATALRLGVWPFLIGDAIKAALAAALLPTAWRLVRR
jgi:biotin transport system substrate-specific component